jgi:hypothetical protein
MSINAAILMGYIGEHHSMASKAFEYMVNNTREDLSSWKTNIKATQAYHRNLAQRHWDLLTQDYLTSLPQLYQWYTKALRDLRDNPPRMDDKTCGPDGLDNPIQPCWDCGVTTKDFYHCFKEGVWYKAMPEYGFLKILYAAQNIMCCVFLCRPCLETRLDRRLTTDDLEPDVPINAGVTL